MNRRRGRLLVLSSFASMKGVNMWGQIIAAGIGAAGSLLGGKKEPEGLGGLGSNAGWTGDGPGFSKRPIDPNQGSNVMGKAWNKTNEVLGSNVGLAAAGLAGGFIDDYRGRRNTRKNHDFWKSKGLNSYEIAGGGSGGPIGAQGNTLGSGPATQIQAQQSFTASENQKNRDNAKEVAEIGQRAAGQSSKREDIKLPFDIAGKTATQRLQAEQLRQSKKTFDERWARLIAGMAEANVRAALMIFDSPLSGEQILNSNGIKSEEDQAEVEYILRRMASWDSISGSLKGVIEGLRERVGTGTEGLISPKNKFIEQIPRMERLKPGEGFRGRNAR